MFIRCCRPTSSANNMAVMILLFLFHLVVGVWSRCGTGRVYVGDIDMNNAELIVFNGIYTELQQQQNMSDKDTTPVYKHESREQFLHVVFLGGQPHWRIGIRGVGGQADFVDYLSAPAGDPTSPTSTRRWYIWNTKRHAWALARRLRATCVLPDFVTCTSGLLSVSGLSGRHQRWHKMRMGTYRVTTMTNQLRPVYKHHIRDDYLFFVDHWWFIGGNVGNKAGVMFVRSGAWRPEHVLATWEVFSGSHFESDSGFTIRCQGNSNEDAVKFATSGTKSAHLSLSDDVSDDVIMCGGTRCNAGRGHCQQMTHGFLCVCVEGFYGPDCQRQIECGVPAQCGSARLVAQTGRSYLDVAIYQCITNGNIPAVTGSVCQLDGTWSSTTPDCVQQSDFITPEHPYVPASHQRH